MVSYAATPNEYPRCYDPDYITLADVREFVEDHLPPECQERDTWHLIGRLYDAARGGDIRDMLISLRLVLELERVPCLMQ